MEFGWSLLSIGPGTAVTEERKVFRRFLGPQAIGDHDQLVERAAEDFVNRLKGFSGDPLPITLQ
jgi:hypothetical protein